MSGVFVTGTDTACGKTAVAAALARSARSDGLRVRVLKPVETGCSSPERPEDALALAEAAGDPSPLEALCPYRLALPAAPDVAARAEGIEIALDVLVRACDAARAAADVVIVEGAGGLLVPIAPGLDMAGLAAALELPLVVVARAALGTINHTLLTLEAAHTRGLRVLGVAISYTEPRLSSAERRNLDRLLEALPVPLLGELSHGGKILAPAPDLKALTRSVGS